MRIVSPLPSATEIVDAVGLGDRLVGVSHECDHPACVGGLPRVTRSLPPSAAASSAAVAAAVRPRLMLLEWLDPPFTAGHWAPEIVRLAGGDEVLGRAGERSRAVTWEAVRAADPEVLVVACCGFDVPRTLAELSLLTARPGYGDLACTRAGRVHVVDGNALFSRPGPRLVEALETLAHLLHPGVHPPAGAGGAGADEGRER